MLSLSDNEFHVINFLIRNFHEKLTIRNIAQRLEFSPAGVFNILKKLEKEGIVVGEKLGTGLFYTLNLENRISEYLSRIVLLYSGKKTEFDIERLKQANAAILENKNLLIVTDNVTIIDVSIPNLNIITKTEDEVTALLRKKDPAMLQFLKDGVVLFGEDRVVEIIKNCISRF